MRLSKLTFFFSFTLLTASAQALDIQVNKKIDPQDTSLELKSDFLILKVPLNVLGEPDFLQACVYTTGNFLSLEAMGFRRIRIDE